MGTIARRTKPDETVVSRDLLSFNQEDFKSESNVLDYFSFPQRLFNKVLTIE